jgi:hypothetical protein
MAHMQMSTAQQHSAGGPPAWQSHCWHCSAAPANTAPNRQMMVGWHHWMVTMPLANMCRMCTSAHQQVPSAGTSQPDDRLVGTPPALLPAHYGTCSVLLARFTADTYIGITSNGGTNTTVIYGTQTAALAKSVSLSSHTS